MHLTTTGTPTKNRGRRQLGLGVALLTVFLIALAACTLGQVDGPVAIMTGSEGGACALARVGGVLVEDPKSGLAFKWDGANMPVVFPYGYTARRVGGVVFLIDPSGRVVGREGDEVHGGGAYGPDRVFVQCGLVVTPQASPGT